MTTVKPLRDEAISVGFVSLKDRLDISFESFKKSLASWDVKAFCQGEKVVGMLMVKGSELHVAVLPEVRGKWLSRSLIREVIGPLVKEYGAARTKVADENLVGHDFVKRIGFAEKEKEYVAVVREGFEGRYFDPTTALISAGGSILGGALQANAASSAADTQANAQNNATNQQLQMFNTVNNQQAPYRQAGANALGAISQGLGLGGAGGDPNAALTPDAVQNLYQHYLGRAAAPDEVAWQIQNTKTAVNFENSITQPGANQEYGARVAAGQGVSGKLYGDQTGGSVGGIDAGQFTHQFNANDLGTNLDPSYNFRRDQTLGAANNLLNASGGNVSGNTLKGVMDYGNNLATTGYQQAYQNYNTNQSNIYNRLASIAGLGQTAGSNATTGASTFSGNIGNSIAATGAAQAGGTVGAANALSGGLNNAMGWYSLSKIMNPGGGGTTAPSFAE